MLYRRTICGALVLGFAVFLAMVWSEPSSASIRIRTGQVGNQAGDPAVGGDDDCFRWIRAPQCGDPVSVSPFSSEFAAAASSPNAAQVVAPVGGWIPTLPGDPNARWINWSRDGNGFGDPASVLYACEFQAEPGCALVDVDLWWAADDQLGDLPGGGANPVGIYLNGTPLTGAWGGTFSGQTQVTVPNVSVQPGTNYFYIYQRDTGCGYAGVILSAELTCVCTDGELGEIRGNKFRDENCDGARDEWEVGLPGWDIQLTGPVDAFASTDSNGDYSFVNLPPGTYTVSEVTQPGWVLSHPPGGSYEVTLCGETVSGYDFANCECTGDELLPPPPCTVAWLPFDEGTGSLVTEVMGGNSGTLSGLQAWVPAQVGMGMDFPTTGDYAELGSAASPSFGFGAFSISTWIRSGNSDGLRRIIADKRDSAGGETGFALFLDNNRLGLRVAASGITEYLSTGSALTDNAWHHVVVVVCRSEDPSNDRITFYVDGVVDDQWLGAAVQQGDVDNTGKLRVGQPASGFGVAPALDATLDELMFFDCCLTVSEVLRLMTGISTATAYLPSPITPCGTTANLQMQICNFSPFPRTYTWTLAGRAGCDVPGPITFRPSAGTVTVPHGPAWLPITATVEVPPWLTGSDISCFELMVFEHETGRCFTIPTGVLRGPSWACVPPVPSVAVTVNQLFQFGFQLVNESETAQFVDVQLLPWSSGENGPSGSLGLDGLPPGEPVVRTVKIPPESMEPIDGTGMLTRFDPADVQEIWLLTDLDGSGVLVRVASIPVFSLLGEESSTVEPGGHEVGTPLGPIRVVPNPFRAETMIELSLGAPESVSVRIVDVSGRTLHGLHDGPLPLGTSRFRWDGRTKNGSHVAPGVYWIRIDGPSGVRSERVLRVR